jgi:predicted small metal-binding protein
VRFEVGNATMGAAVELRWREPPMKTMTCKELGGTCNAKLRASSWDEMANTMTKHVMNRHPEVAKKMVEMYEADPKQWGREMKPKWDATPDSKSKAA